VTRVARYSYERLSYEGAALLAGETSRHFGHAATTLVFEAGPLARASGVDFEAIRSAIESRLHLVPAYRRKLRRVPIENHPVLVDDREFNLDYHIRHIGVAQPGEIAQVQKVVGRLQAQRLDRSRPLWECWVLEGLAGGRFALVMKQHAVLAESGGDLMQVLLSPDPHESFEPAPPFVPRPMPSAVELVRDEVVRQLRLPQKALIRMREFVRESDSFGREIQQRAQAVANLLGYSIRELHETPLSGEPGPHRRFETLVFPLADAKLVRSELGGSVHDVLLAAVAGAVGAYFRARHMNPAVLDFRAAVPVSLKSGDKNEGVGEWILDLPIWERDPARRLEHIRRRTEELNRQRPALGARTLNSVAKWTSSRLLAQGVRAISERTPVNVRIANVPGPQSPVYLRGARLVEAYGTVPLARSGGLGIAMFSYDGKLCVGVNADYDRVADLGAFTALLADSMRELVSEARRRARKLKLVSGAS
jgi:WS/DGAT/MGAT family acyltransferase